MFSGAYLNWELFWAVIKICVLIKVRLTSMKCENWMVFFYVISFENVLNFYRSIGLISSRENKQTTMAVVASKTSVKNYHVYEWHTTTCFSLRFFRYIGFRLAGYCWIMVRVVNCDCFAIWPLEVPFHIIKEHVFELYMKCSKNYRKSDKLNRFLINFEQIDSCSGTAHTRNGWGGYTLLNHHHCSHFW